MVLCSRTNKHVIFDNNVCVPIIIGGVEPSPGPRDKTEFEENKSGEDATSAFSCTQAVLDSLYSDQHDKNDGNYDQAETLQTPLWVWVVTWIGSMMWVNRSDNQSNQVVEKTSKIILYLSLIKL